MIDFCTYLDITNLDLVNWWKRVWQTCLLCQGLSVYKNLCGTYSVIDISRFRDSSSTKNWSCCQQRFLSSNPIKERGCCVGHYTNLLCIKYAKPNLIQACKMQMRFFFMRFRWLLVPSNVTNHNVGQKNVKKMVQFLGNCNVA